MPSNLVVSIYSAVVHVCVCLGGGGGGRLGGEGAIFHFIVLYPCRLRGSHHQLPYLAGKYEIKPYLRTYVYYSKLSKTT